MKRLLALGIVALMSGIGGVAHAAFIQVGSESAFLGYFSDVRVEDFEDETFIPGLSIDDDPWPGSIHDGVYENVVDEDTDPPSRQSYIFDSMWGFGGLFDCSPNTEGASIDVYVGTTFVMNIPNTATGEFYGFYSDADPFSEVIFREGGVPLEDKETYYAMELVIAPVAAPIPATIYLLGTGLAGLVGLRIRFRK